MDENKILDLMDIFISKLTKQQLLINEYHLKMIRLDNLSDIISNLKKDLNLLENQKEKGSITDKNLEYLDFLPLEIKEKEIQVELLRARLNDLEIKLN